MVDIATVVSTQCFSSGSESKNDETHEDIYACGLIVKPYTIIRFAFKVYITVQNRHYLKGLYSYNAKHLLWCFDSPIALKVFLHTI